MSNPHQSSTNPGRNPSPHGSELYGYSSSSESDDGSVTPRAHSLPSVLEAPSAEQVELRLFNRYFDINLVQRLQQVQHQQTSSMAASSSRLDPTRTESATSEASIETETQAAPGRMEIDDQLGHSASSNSHHVAQLTEPAGDNVQARGDISTLTEASGAVERTTTVSGYQVQAGRRSSAPRHAASSSRPQVPTRRDSPEYFSATEQVSLSENDEMESDIDMAPSSEDGAHAVEESDMSDNGTQGLPAIPNSSHTGYATYSHLVPNIPPSSGAGASHGIAATLSHPSSNDAGPSHYIARPASRSTTPRAVPPVSSHPRPPPGSQERHFTSPYELPPGGSVYHLGPMPQQPPSVVPHVAPPASTVQAPPPSQVLAGNPQYPGQFNEMLCDIPRAIHYMEGMQQQIGGIIQGLEENNRLIREAQSPANRPTPHGVGGNSMAQAAPGTPNRRGAERNALARAIRRYFDDVLSPTPPDPRAIASWRPENGRACTIESLMPDFTSSANTPWNKSVAAVFVEHFMDSNVPEAANFSAEVVKRLYIARFRSLRRRGRWDRDVVERERQLQQNRRRERKCKLYRRRLKAAGAFPETERFVEVLGAYGIDGMSSDESDHGLNQRHPGHPLYRIRHKLWRHPATRACFDTLDALHRHRRYQRGRRAGPGAQPHQRLTSNSVSTRPPVPGLDRGAYHPEWLASQPAWSLRDLQVTNAGEPIDFNHHPDVHRIVASNHGRMDAGFVYL